MHRQTDEGESRVLIASRGGKNKTKKKGKETMKATINGKRYNTSNCEVLGKKNHYNNGNYSGTTSLLRAPNGDYLVWCDTNGQDLYLRDFLIEWDAEDHPIDDFSLTDEQEKRCAELGLITMVA